MLPHVFRYIKKHCIFPRGSRVLVGVSGGMDSVALLHILRAFQEKLGIEPEAAHFNHGIRAEAGEDERFVEALCEKLRVPLHIGRADVPALAEETGVSLEVAAREARHAFFANVMRESHFGKLALAHHLDDQAETVLLRLVRGSGADGLGAMAPVEDNGIVRPLLCVGREDIHAWCVENTIDWREDASNADTSIPRNWVRHELMPLLRQHLNPSAPAVLCRAAELLRDDEYYLSAEADKALARVEIRKDGGIAVPVDFVAGLHPAVQSRALRQLIARAGLACDVERVNIDDVASLLEDGMTGRRIDLDGGYAALREAAALVIVPRLPEETVYPPVRLAVPGLTRAAGGVFACEALDGIPAGYRDHVNSVQYFDLDAFPQDVVARSRMPGDRFHPLGATGGKKLKEFLIDRKAARWGRGGIPLLARGGDVLWVVGHAIADSVKITGGTVRVLKITYSTGEDNKETL